MKLIADLMIPDSEDSLFACVVAVRFNTMRDNLRWFEGQKINVTVTPTKKGHFMKLANYPVRKSKTSTPKKK